MDDPTPTQPTKLTIDDLRKIHAVATGLVKPSAPPVPPSTLLIADECPGVEGAGPLGGGSRTVDAGEAFTNPLKPVHDTHTASNAEPSLDSQETSVRGDFDRFWAEKGSEAEYHAAPVLDECSLSSCFRHSGWAPIRKRVFEALGRTGQAGSRRAAFGCCGSYSWVEVHNTKPGNYRVRANHCNDRLCTPCANQRSHQLTQAVMDIIGTSPISFITLTLCGKNEPLGQLVDRLYKHFRALRLHPLWAENVNGGAAFLEIKWSDKAQRWHPHLHILADAKFIDKGQLSEVWRTISKDSFIVDIKRVRDHEVTARYVTKYASKPLNTSFANTPKLLDEALLALKGRRLCLTFGTWYGTALTAAEDDNLDLDDYHDYHKLCDLESLLVRANHGEREAVAIIKAARLEGLWRATLCSQPPPS